MENIGEETCNTGQRRCPVCGNVVAGRIDKVFCSDDCRCHYHNVRYRRKNAILQSNSDLLLLWDNATFLFEKKSCYLLKFIVILSGICKIISTFGTLKLKGKR